MALEFQGLLESEERMQEEVFVHLPLEKVERYYQTILVENSRLISDYLASTLHHKIIPINASTIQGVHP